jgi:hypothetical protein
MLWPLESVTGRGTEPVEKTVFEKDTLVTVTFPEPVTVTVKGWDDSLPLEPLKLRAVVEKVRVPAVEC